jgi:hypothetical protein
VPEQQERANLRLLWLSTAMYSHGEQIGALHQRIRVITAESGIPPARLANLKEKRELSPRVSFALTRNTISIQRLKNDVCFFLSQSQIYINLTLWTGTVTINMRRRCRSKKNTERPAQSRLILMLQTVGLVGGLRPAALFIPHAPNKEFALSQIYIFSLTQK